METPKIRRTDDKIRFYNAKFFIFGKKERYSKSLLWRSYITKNYVKIKAQYLKFISVENLLVPVFLSTLLTKL